MRHPPSDAAGILGTPARSIDLLLRGMALTLVLAGMVLAPAAQASQRTAAQSTIHFYGLADTNVADMWTGTLLPARRASRAEAICSAACVSTLASCFDRGGAAATCGRSMLRLKLPLSSASSRRFSTRRTNAVNCSRSGSR